LPAPDAHRGGSNGGDERFGGVALFILGDDYHLGDLLWFTAVVAEYRRHFAPSAVFVGLPDRPISRILDGSPVLDGLLYGSAAEIIAQVKLRQRVAVSAPSTEPADPLGDEFIRLSDIRARGAAKAEQRRVAMGGDTGMSSNSRSGSAEGGPHGSGQTAGSRVMPANQGQSPRLTVHDLRGLPIALAMIRDWRRRLPWLYYRDLWLDTRGQWLATFLRMGPLTEPRPVLSLNREDRVHASNLPTPYVVLAPRIGSYALPVIGHAWRRIKAWDESKWEELASRLREHGFQPVTLAAAEQRPIAGTVALLGLGIRQAAGVIEGSQALITGESGLWFVAAALETPFVIVPWWLPRRVDWAAPMRVQYHLIRRADASVDRVFSALRELIPIAGAARQPASGRT
jgi:hypothetical protein